MGKTSTFYVMKLNKYLLHLLSFAIRDCSKGRVCRAAVVSGEAMFELDFNLSLSFLAEVISCWLSTLAVSYVKLVSFESIWSRMSSKSITIDVRELANNKCCQDRNSAGLG